MVTRLFASLIALMIVAGCSWAQEPGSAKVPPNTSTADNEAQAGETDGTDAAELFSGVDEEPTPEEEPAEDAATADIEGAGEEGAGEGPAMTAERPAAADERATAEARKVFELTQRIAALETELDELKQTLYSTQRTLARLQDSGELSRRALGAMVEDADLRGTMGELLQGKIRLNNTTDQDVIMYINGTAWTVVPGKSFVHAPVGTVSFLYDPAGKPEFKGIQEWMENEITGQFELEYEVRTPGATATERSVVRQLP
ncbi:hypothetical protein NG895_29770 [Aeoliella sp. ICT_H6.2]|uniref:Uncharacterized protein n=1 Tax=Aeoliella straminimaris TaxID=2954799 RepID=A0A9X2JKD1_9BACT|nr:hypothetical protein [Aeoliella straminimaris]MCO6048103.1 hypothetical protein [Aeoliella straminimaris]